MKWKEKNGYNYGTQEYTEHGSSIGYNIESDIIHNLNFNGIVIYLKIE